LVPVLQPLVEQRNESEWLFTTARNTPLRANNWRVREFNAAVKVAKLETLGLTPHKLRHTAASLAIAAGADVKVLQLMLGHADASMTLNVYGHLFPDRLDEVADTLDARRLAALSPGVACWTNVGCATLAAGRQRQGESVYLFTALHVDTGTLPAPVSLLLLDDELTPQPTRIH
jgi:hypothetical protein